jgi:hypothetical protein
MTDSGKHARRKRWSELSGPARAGVLLAAAVELCLKLIAARDLAKRPADQIRGDKRIWAPLLLVNFFGPIAYLAFGRR